MHSTLSLKHNNKLINLKHNNRSFDEQEWGQSTNKHINRELTKYNTIFIQEDIRDAYDNAFGEALDEYNAKQKREDRKISNYYEYIKALNDEHKKKSRKGKATTKYNLQDEIILTIGNKASWDNLHNHFKSEISDPKQAEEAFINHKKQLSDKIFGKFLEEFQDKHKHLYVFNAVAHYDEAGAPHLHMNFFGMAEGIKKGLRLQPRTTRAIAQDLEGDFYNKMLESDQKKYALAKENQERKKQGLKLLQADRKGEMSASADVYKVFLSQSKQIFINTARENGIDYVEGKTNDLEDMDEYKDAMRQIDKYVEKEKQKKLEELKQFDIEIADKKAEINDLQQTTEWARKEKENASREERIARENALLAQKQAEGFKKELDRIKKENQNKAKEFEEIKTTLKSLDDEINEKETRLTTINENINSSQAVLNDVNANFNERMYDLEKQQILKKINDLSNVMTYKDDGVRPSKINSGELIINKNRYNDLKQKASIWANVMDFTDFLIKKINESSIVKNLNKKIEELNQIITNLTNSVTKLKNKVNNLTKELTHYREHDEHLSPKQKEQINKWVAEHKEWQKKENERMINKQKEQEELKRKKRSFDDFER